jgi:hypothetical protein
VNIVTELLQPRLDAVSMKNLVKIKIQKEIKGKKKALAIVVGVKDIIPLTAMLLVISEAII